MTFTDKGSVCILFGLNWENRFFAIFIWQRWRVNRYEQEDISSYENLLLMDEFHLCHQCIKHYT